jgi:hypothetical protein
VVKAAVAVSLIVMNGCASVGPPILTRDRFDYSSAVADSWKRQTLLNIVKLRYLDSPIFLDVAQIVSGYQLQTTLTAGGTASLEPSSVPTIGSFLNFGAQGSFTDRPTITYVPLTGDQYIRGIITPIRPEQLFSAVLAGWPAEAILFAVVSSLNEFGNQRLAGVAPRAADPRFLRIVQLIGNLQASSALGFRIAESKPPARSVMFFRRAELSERERQEIDELRQLLRLDPQAEEFDLVTGATPASGREIAVQTRSLIQILLEVGGQVSVPPEHIAEGRATPALAEPAPISETVRRLRIHSSTERATHAFLSVPYRDHWFWIDDRDLHTKRNFALLMLLFALADTGEKKAAPLLTIPTQ